MKRRYGALPVADRVRLGLAFVAVQAILWFFVHGLAARFALAVLTAAVLGVLTTTRSRYR